MTPIGRVNKPRCTTHTLRTKKKRKSSLICDRLLFQRVCVCCFVVVGGVFFVFFFFFFCLFFFFCFLLLLLFFCLFVSAVVVFLIVLSSPKHALLVHIELDYYDLHKYVWTHHISTHKKPITKTCLFKYIENFTTQKGKFSDKKFCYFLIYLFET